jgi:hypothetical protein
MGKSPHNIDKTSAAHLKRKQHQAKKEKQAKSIVIPNFVAEETTPQTNEQTKPLKNKKQNNEDKSQQDGGESTTISRKEKRKQILSQRLERKLTALEKLHEQNTKLLENEDAAAAEDESDSENDDDEKNNNNDASSSSSSDADEDAAAVDVAGKNPKDENDEEDDEDEEKNENKKDAENNSSASAAPPKKQQIKQVAAAAAAPRKAKLGGTYWKERKEKQKRTIFVGGIPPNAGLGLVRRLVNQYGADGAITDPKHEIEVEFIRPKNFEAAKFRNASSSIPKNAYCVLPSVEMATRVANALDGVWVHPEEAIPITDRDANMWRQNNPQSRDKPSKLRVNSADDKSQREVAIGKRKGGDGNKDQYYRNNKRGAKPGSLPPKKFGNRQ